MKRLVATLGMVASSTILAPTSLTNEFGPMERCATRLGIEWTFEDGATDRLDAFALCVTMEGMTR